MSDVDVLRAAVVATRHGGGAARTAKLLRASGPGSLDERFASLDADQRGVVDAEVEHLHRAGVRAVVLGADGYPPHLARLSTAPPALFLDGPPELLTMRGVGVCGSRHASEEGLRAAVACGELAAQEALAAVSGYARGVDMATHVSTLRSGGCTIIVLPEGITRYRVRRGDFSDVHDPDRVLVVSQFSPSQPWSAAGAMTRNGVIIGLGLGLVVVEAGESGGTLAAGEKALAVNRPVIALEFADVARGNAVLIGKGAGRARSRTELHAALKRLDAEREEPQLGLPLSCL